jgi:hypothetical protein
MNHPAIYITNTGRIVIDDETTCEFLAELAESCDEDHEHIAEYLPLTPNNALLS